MLEALIAPDPLGYTWRDACREVCEWHGLARGQVDAEGVTPDPFHGYYTRGPVSGVQALQPLLMLGQIATQERYTRLAFFDIDNADSVQIQAGSSFTDFGAAVGDSQGKPLVHWRELSDDDYPTSVAVHFQDPSSGYGPQVEHFGRRYPSASPRQNVQELRFDGVVLTRKKARNAAATIMRRARINGRMAAFDLPASYCHVLENDLLTWTDQDTGHDLTIRVTKREIGTNFIVRVEGVIERTDIAVSGSPAQGHTGVIQSPLTGAATVTGLAIDAPPVIDSYGVTPGVHLVACGTPGGTWAGCTVYLSENAGADWRVLAQLHAQHGIGVSTTALASATASEAHGTSALTWDAVSTVTVEFDNVGQAPLVTVSEAEVVAGTNWFAVLDDDHQVEEVFGARDVTQNSATNYTLDYLLRGLRGTFSGCASSHAAGSRIVYLGASYGLSGKFAAIAGLSTPRALQFKFVPPGSSLGAVDAVELETTLRNVQPFPVRDITATIGASPYDARIDWTHWTRRNLVPGATGPYPLDEPTESYDLVILDPVNALPVRIVHIRPPAGSNTVRDRYFDYTATMQTTDGYTPSGSTTFYVQLQQVGQYGRSPAITTTL
jgi:hypothetical protein